MKLLPIIRHPYPTTLKLGYIRVRLMQFQPRTQLMNYPNSMVSDYRNEIDNQKKNTINIDEKSYSRKYILPKHYRERTITQRLNESLKKSK